MQFKNAYEVIVLKKAAIEINPFNKFVSHGINPQTKNPMIIINQEWFSSMPDEQQTFLLDEHLKALYKEQLLLV